VHTMSKTLNLFNNRTKPQECAVITENEKLFYALLHAETEDEVDRVLKDYGLFQFDDDTWLPYGGKNHQNNFGHITAQHSEASGALAEKIINALDAVLMRECWKSDIDPESDSAPRSMAQAAEEFYEIKGGRLENVDQPTIRDLADNIHLVATGIKDNLPNYLIIDKGEGQTPIKIPETICSLSASNKVNIHFVQGKYNSGGAGALPFCGKKNYQLIISRRCPDLPTSDQDNTKELWGFTLVRLNPGKENDRNPSYVFLAPNKKILSFKAEEIKIIPKVTVAKKPLTPYCDGLPYGTCIKLYSYKWHKKSLGSLITLDTRYELDRFLHTPCLPFYIDETRSEYKKAHNFSTPFKGLSASLVENRSDIQPGFPDSGNIRPPGIGTLPIRLVVFKHRDSKGNIVKQSSERRKRAGIYFLVNGQTHGQLSSDFITRTVGFKHAGKFCMVTVDCENMDPAVGRFFFMASRDRARKTEEYETVIKELKDYLKKHEGLKLIDNQIQSEQLNAATSEDEPAHILEKLFSSDKSLIELLPEGGPIRSSISYGETEAVKELKQFPTYFRIAKEPEQGLIKKCPINKWCRVEFETDVRNDYFTRAEQPGRIIIEPEGICIADGPLWQGKYPIRLSPPQSCKIGDEFQIKVTVQDEYSTVEPLMSNFKLVIEKAQPKSETSATGHRQRKPKVGGAGLPRIPEIYKDKWDEMDPSFDKFSALRMEGGLDEKPMVFFVNMDNIHLKNYLAKETKDENIKLAKYAFKYGLFLSAFGQFRELQRIAAKQSEDSLIPPDCDIHNLIELSMNGLARVIIPLIRQLSKNSYSLLGEE